MARDDIALNPIANAPRIQTSVDDAIPDNYQFEILRLQRRIAELEAIVHDKNDRQRRALAMFEDELLFWHTFMNDHMGETMGQLQQRIGRLEAALAHIKDIQPHIVPPLETHVHWKKGTP